MESKEYLNRPDVVLSRQDTITRITLEKAKVSSKEHFTDNLINQIVRTAVSLKRETSFAESAAEVISEREDLDAKWKN